MLTRRACLVATALLVSAAGVHVSAQAQKRDVDMKTPDGTLLKATYVSPGAPGPGILLLHQCSMNRHAWDDLAADLSDTGIHVLAFDYRGFGDSQGTLPQPPPSRPSTNTQFGPTISASWVGHKDVDLAYLYLRSLPGVDKKRMAVGGASCGAGFAADLTIHHPEIRALVLMSGRISAGAAAHIAATPWLPVFGAAARDELPIAYEGIQAAIATSTHQQSIMKMYPGARHGVEIFLENPSLRTLVVDWLRTALK